MNETRAGYAVHTRVRTRPTFISRNELARASTVGDDATRRDAWCVCADNARHAYRHRVLDASWLSFTILDVLPARFPLISLYECEGPHRCIFTHAN